MNIQEIKVSECAAFQDNPFQVRDDEGMELLVQSIKECQRQRENVDFRRNEM